MSENNCHTQNLLVRDGTSQQKRFLAALSPAFVEVDERSLSDQINLLREYASLFQFYNERNEANGDWQAFFNTGVASLIALLGEFPLEKAADAFDQLRSEVADPASSNADLRRAYKGIFDLIFTLLRRVENWHVKAVDDTLLRRELRRHIGSSLRGVFAEALSYYKEGKKNPKLIAENYHNPYHTAFPTLDSAELITREFSNEWSLSPALSWSDYLNSIGADNSIFLPNRSTVAGATNAGLNRLERLLEKVLSVYRQLEENQNLLLSDILENYPGHQPHMVLMLAFFQLLDHARNELNTLTARHLDFYYKEVLQLDFKAATPDTVHLVLELAKQVEKALLKEATEVKAGKDDSGVERIYRSDFELVANKASVAELRSLYLRRHNNEKLFSAEVSDSADGAGAEFEEENPKWKAFGKDQSGLTADERTMQDARVGFAISSYDLFLQEGERQLTLTVHLKNKPSSQLISLLKQGLSCRITAEEDWFYFKPQLLTAKQEISKQTGNKLQLKGNQLILRLMLGKADPAVVAVDPELHGEAYTTTNPVLEILAVDGVNGNSYETLSSIEPLDITLETDVKDLRELILQNDSSLIDTAKPFEMFGPQARVSSSFYLGSNELMGKDLSSLKLSGSWLDLPADFTTHYANYGETGLDTSSFTVAVEDLRHGEWIANSLPGSLALFNENKGALSATFELSLIAEGKSLENEPLTEPLVQYTSDSDRGFLRLRLTAPAMAFGHKKFPLAMQQQAIIVAAMTTPDPSLLPKEPYTPKLTNFKVDYTAFAKAGFSSSGDYAANELKLYHIHPFGQVEVHPALGSKKIRLAPEFHHKHKGQQQEHAGEFYIGIKDLDPPQNLSLLIQLAEGSEDPKLPTTPVHWFYLKQDEWLEFKTQEILRDTTKGLLQSGILQVAIPRAATSDHHILPSGLHWLKASMSENTAAVCDLVEVRAQAVSATFDDRGNDPRHLFKPLAAGQATKLAQRVNSIKSVSQPYASFGGRQQESSPDFYRRVSERLRHKDRGVSIWDYERLVLEEFPELHKVKCINHSSYGYDPVLAKDFNSEFAPGYLSVVVVPKLNNKNALNPYEPAVSKARLEEIKTYLHSLMPAWAIDKLKVLNPLYEQIKVELEVEFHTGYDRGFYEKQLNTDIKKLLAPWAFQQAEDILFGGKIYRSSIINYVEERPYVDYVKNFKMSHYVDGVLHKSDVGESLPTTARSIFVSISNKDPALEHLVKEVAVKC